MVVGRFRSLTRPWLEHVVKEGADGVVYCSCPRWRYQHSHSSRRYDCRHVKMCREARRRGGNQLELFGEQFSSEGQ